MSTGQCDLGRPSIEDPYFQMTLICIILITKLAGALPLVDPMCKYIACYAVTFLSFVPGILHQHHNVKRTTTLKLQQCLKISEF